MSKQDAVSERELSAIRQIVEHDSTYPVQAYRFVIEGVAYTVEKIKKQNVGPRHITGGELTAGMLEFAVERFAFLAPDVFRYWHFLNGRDIGNTVFSLIGAQLLAASPSDRIEDFDACENLPETLQAMLVAKRK